MPSFIASAVRRTLPFATFDQLRQLLHQTAQTTESHAIALVLTEADVLSEVAASALLPRHFSVVVSESFSALLLAQPDETPVLDWQPPTPLCCIDLSFAPEAIAAFLTQLLDALPEKSSWHQLLQQAQQGLKPNDAVVQSEFTLQLVEVLTEPRQAGQEIPFFVSGSVCKPVEDALRQQVEQERLLNQVITQLSQSFELPEILATAVQQGRQFLQADRLVIYQCDAHLSSVVPDPKPLPKQDLSLRLNSGYGCITYEDRASDEIPSVLHLTEEGTCWVEAFNWQEQYGDGPAFAVNDISTVTSLSPCLRELVHRTPIRAELAAAIVIQDKLWGLLIAHQCFEPRVWQDSEKVFLQRIAEHLAIAIYQAQLYSQLQQQKQTLEERVIERTQELHDALMAAQSASRARSDFLATMSHELRTPLTCVIGMSATLLRWSFGHLSQRQRHYLQTIHDSGEHLLALINDILDLSQMEAGRMVLEVSEFSLAKLLGHSLETLQEKADANGIKLVLDCRIEPHRDRFTGDRRRLKQILLNLLSNAIKFTPEGGNVTLRAWFEANIAVFQVEDTGIGIAEHQRSLLFQKFQQLDTSYQRKYEGTGLGLALTKQLIELHNGWIDVDSTVGVGSIFTVRLPAQSVPTLNSTLAPIVSANGAQGRIVLIETHEESAMLICDLLTAAGYHVVWIVEGSTAIKQIEILRPLLVIVDMQLSGMDGYEVMRYLRHSSIMQAVKIVVLTAKNIGESESHYLEAGADGCLKKPVEPQALLHKVAALMSHQTSETPASTPVPPT